VAAPRISKFNQSTQFTWTNGDPFNGFVALALIRPAKTDETSSSWRRLVVNGVSPRQWLPPGFTFIPIVNGKINSALGIYYNSDINPPGSQYIAYYYDSSKVFIAGPTDPFSVNVATVPLPILPLPNPEGEGFVTPVPDVSCIDGGEIPEMPCKCGNLVDFEVPAGVVDGVNATFTFEHTPTPDISLHVYFRGSRLTPTVHYIQSGAQITFLSPFIPEPGDLFYADYIWE
jgi:hypothetical protein